MPKFEKKKVTLSLDSNTYDNFRDYCEKNAIMLSRKIEIWIEDFMKDKLADLEKKETTEKNKEKGAKK